MLNILLIDNFDSFTNNIADYLRGLREGLQVDIVRNDRIDLLQTPEFDSYDAIVISPGPGNVGVSADLGISLDILRSDTRPILGICLGHQAMIALAGGKVELATQPMHGRLSQIESTGKGLFAGLPRRHSVMRYHSWTVNPDLPAGYVCDARSTDGVVMGIRSLHQPRWGVQFHPESIASTFGRGILDNFLTLVEQHRTAASTPAACQQTAAPARRLCWQQPRPAISPIALVEVQGLTNGRRPMLLESSLVQEGLSRYSIIEVPDAEDRSVTYDAATQTLRDYCGDALIGCRKGSIFDDLAANIGEIETLAGDPPFPFCGGLVGWLGYELKSELLGVTSWPSPTADAAFRHVSQFFVVDHQEDVTYTAVCLPCDTPQADFDAALLRMQKLASLAQKFPAIPPAVATPRQTPLQFRMRHEADAYLERIKSCQASIAEGESYELCLTNQIEAQISGLDSWEFYKLLRLRNAATYAGYLTIGGTEVVSSSPECFLRVDRTGLMHAKPIKGTARRGQDAHEDLLLSRNLQNSEKERAENLMIVDLMRHDFATISIPGTVEVPKLCAIETYPSVHQLVSTIRGRLRPGQNFADALRACFPGGSMTGAPKIRSVKILDRLEGGPRGIYSGALGWIDYSGQADLSIVIRTLVKQGDHISIGCGGAITYLSDPQAELDEMMLKSQSLMRALAEHLTGDAGKYKILTTESTQAHNLHFVK